MTKHMGKYVIKFAVELMISFSYPVSGGSVVKTPPAVQEMWAQFLGQEDPLEEEMESHFTMLAWKIPWTEEPGGL